MSIEPGKLGEPIQEKELLFGFWVTNEDEDRGPKRSSIWWMGLWS